jgi:hypothetical protein
LATANSSPNMGIHHIGVSMISFNWIVESFCYLVVGGLSQFPARGARWWTGNRLTQKPAHTSFEPFKFYLFRWGGTIIFKLLGYVTKPQWRHGMCTRVSRYFLSPQVVSNFSSAVCIWIIDLRILPSFVSLLEIARTCLGFDLGANQE